MFIALNPDGTEKWRDSFGFYESSLAIAEDGTVYVVSSRQDGFQDLSLFGTVFLKYND
ncbi:MAG: hypothetical protein KAW45_08710 [Thermoplasmatales archaeon]|nr:hypothetical protein [Thermoplasmatales archaeon]